MRDSLYLTAFVLVLASLSSGQNSPPAPRGAVPGTVDVTRPPYNARGDGKSDDSAAIQRALDQNPSGVIVLPDRVGGNVADYVCSRTLRLKGPGQVLCGSVAGYGAGVYVEFPRGVTGIEVDNDLAPSACIRDLNLLGSEPWTSTKAAEAVLPAGFGGNARASSADGIRIRANLVRVENVLIRHFGRHGIAVGGADNAFGDNFSIVNCTAMNNRGCGLHIQGADGNAGTTIQFRATINQLWGIHDRGALGNVHISPQTHANHYDETPGKAASKVWAAAGEAGSGGPFRSRSNIGHVWIGPYAELDQPACDFDWRDVVIGGDIGPAMDNDHFWINTWANSNLGWNTPFLKMTTAKDAIGQLVLKAGKRVAADAMIRTLNPDNSVRWDEVRGAGPHDWSWWEGEAFTGRQRLAFTAKGPTTLTGALTLTPCKDADAAKGSIYLGTDGQFRTKDGAGKVARLGSAAQPVRVRKTATIPRGQRSVQVQHGLGGAPAIEDVGVMSTRQVWLSDVTDTALTFTAASPAPSGGLTFTYSASRQP